MRLIGVLLVGLSTCVASSFGQDANGQKLSMLRISDRQSAQTLNRLKQMLQDGNYSVASKLLFDLTGQARVETAGTSTKGDSFHWNAAGALVGVQAEARRSFDAAGKPAFDAFETVYGVEAQQQFAAARRAGDTNKLAHIGRSYFFTAAGFQALDWLAGAQLEAGFPEIAAANWRRLIESQAHASRINPSMLRKTVYALTASQRPADLEGFFKLASERFAPSADELARWKELARREPIVRRTSGLDWKTPFGNPANQLVTTGSVPYLRPKWSHPLIADRHEGLNLKLRAAVRDWFKEPHLAESNPLGIANAPVVVGQQVIVRTSDGMNSFDVETGSPLWRYTSETSTLDAFEQWAAAAQSFTENRVEHLGLNNGYLGNAAIGMLSASENRVFMIEPLGLRFPTRNGLDAEPKESPAKAQARLLNRFARHTELQIRNRLVCVRMPSATAATGLNVEAKTEWAVSNDGPLETNPLTNYVFLGPPLPIGGSVFVMAEIEREIHVVELNAATGSLLRSQPLCIVEMPLLDRQEEYRLPTACLLAHSGSTLVCPTEAGAVVGVDSQLGTLKWAYVYLDPRQNRGAFVRHSPSVWPDAPHVSGDSVYVLPRSSPELHALDLETGRLRWRIDRQEACYIGAVTESTLLVVGHDWVRAIHRDDGRTLWTTPVGLIAGRGIVIGKNFVVPLDTGSVIALDTATGHSVGVSRSALLRAETESRQPVPHWDREDFRRFGTSKELVVPQWRVGNLIPVRDAVVSITPEFVTLFDQADAVKRDRAATSPPDQLALRQADLEIALGQYAAATERLTQLLANPSQASTHSLAHALLREIGLQQVFAAQRQADPALEQRGLKLLNEHSQTDAERIQARSLRLLSRSTSQQWAETLRSAEELFQLSKADLTEVADRSEHAIAPRVLAQREFARAYAKATPEERKSWRVQSQASDHAESVTSRTVAVSDQLGLSSELPESDERRLLAADAAILRRAWHDAEALLAPVLRRKSAPQRAAALMLSIVWQAECGLLGEASRSLMAFEQEYADSDITHVAAVPFRSCDEVFDLGSLRSQKAPVRGRDLVRSLRPEHPMTPFWSNLRPLAWPVKTVRVENKLLSEANPTLTTMFAGSRRRETMPSLDVEAFPLSIDGDDVWSFFDRATGTERHRLPVAPTVDIDQRELTRSSLHYIPLGLEQRLQAISYVDRLATEPLWSVEIPMPVQNCEPGPATVGTAVFRCDKHLIAVDAASGQLKWRRSDLTLAHGLVSDLSTFMVADDEVLVTFKPDGQSYDLLDMQTGITLRRGQLPIDRQVFPGLPLGRKLLFATRGASGKEQARIQIWEPLADRILFDVPYTAFNLTPQPMKDGRIALLQPNGRFTVFSPDQDEPVIDTRITFPVRVARREPSPSNASQGFLQPPPIETPLPLDRLDAPHAFADHEFVYLNVRRSDQASSAGRRFVPVSDSIIPIEPLHYGELMAIDPATHKVLWKRECRTRAVLRLDRCRLPFLVTVVLVQPRGQVDSQSFELEVIDKRTGETLALSPMLLPMRPVHYEVDLQQGRLSLLGLTRWNSRGADHWNDSPYGLMSKVVLDFSRATQRLTLDDGIGAE